MQQRIKEHGTMPSRKDESITSRPFGITRIVAQVTRPHGISHRGGSHGESWMTRIGLLNGIRSEKADGIDCTCLKIIWHKNLPKKGYPILPSAHRGYNRQYSLDSWEIITCTFTHLLRSSLFRMARSLRYASLGMATSTIPIASPQT